MIILEFILVMFLVYLGWQQQDAYETEKRENQKKFEERRKKNDSV
jgi:threonine/homoserine/homoserine lactone efflux protein